VVPFNPTIPPPLAYRRNEAMSGMDAESGCSLSMISYVAHRYGYALLHTEYWFATLVRTEYRYLFGNVPADDLSIWHLGYWTNRRCMDLLTMAMRRTFAGSQLSPVAADDGAADDRPRWWISEQTESWLEQQPNRTLLQTVGQHLMSQMNISVDSSASPTEDSWFRNRYIELFIAPPQLPFPGSIDAIQLQSFTLGKKLFCLAVQSPDALSPHFDALVNGTTTTDVVQLSWKSEVDGAEFLPNSMWGEGRNRLRELMIEREETVNDGRYLYWIFMDGDDRLLTPPVQSMLLSKQLFFFFF
jgi:hypothetical protein